MLSQCSGSAECGLITENGITNHSIPALKLFCHGIYSIAFCSSWSCCIIVVVLRAIGLLVFHPTGGNLKL
jgi:hypothetical protein